MDQKNTIVKCKAHPDCLFNHNGVCDNYVINIGEDGKCECYVETCPEGINVTEEEVIYENAQRMLEKTGVTLIEPKGEVKRGQRAKGNFIDDMRDIDDKHLRETVTIKMKIAELNKPNKNKSIISDWDYAATPDICKTCKKIVYGQPCKYKDVSNGVWACYEMDESIKKAGTLNECWWCDFFNSEKRGCKHKNPDIDKLGCHSLQSTGGNR